MPSCTNFSTISQQLRPKAIALGGIAIGSYNHIACVHLTSRGCKHKSVPLILNTGNSAISNHMRSSRNRKGQKSTMIFRWVNRSMTRKHNTAVIHV